MRANTVRIDVLSLFEEDGNTPLEGVVLGDLAVSLVYNGVRVVAGIALEDGRDAAGLDVGLVLFEAVAGEPGFYRFRWRVGAAGSWLLQVAYSGAPPQRYEVAADATANDSDDIAGLIAALPGAADVVVDVTGIDDVRAGSAWVPIVRFRRKSTMSLFDPTPLVSLQVLDADGAAELQLVAGADVDRLSLGRYTETLDAPPAAGIVYLRVRFRLDGAASADDDLIEVKAVQVLPALADGEVGTGATAKLEHIYTCPTFLEDAGYDLTNLTTRQRWSLIRAVARLIDEMTTQWFNADFGDWWLEGRGRPLAMHSTDIPIVHIEEVAVDGGRVNQSMTRARGGDNPYWAASGIPEGLQVVSATEYVNRGRQLERILSDWPSGPMCLRLTGALGWVENPKLLATTSTTELTADATYIEVADVAGFQVRDVVDIIGEHDAVRVILTSVSRIQRRIYFDIRGEPTDPISEGAVVRTFGQVPGGIEEVAAFLFGNVLRERRANTAGQVPAEPGRVKREATDDYEIEFFGSKAAESGSMTTGSPKYDAILCGFSPPARIRIV